MSGQPHTAALAPSSSNIKRLSGLNHTAPSPNKQTSQASVTGTSVKDVVSPAELCGFVDSLLNQLEAKFDDMSEQMLTRMNEMSDRIDNLDTAVQDLLHDDIGGGTSPAPKR